MDDLPAIWILLTTYKRTDLARRTIRGVLDNLIYPKPKVGFFVADDGSGDDHLFQVCAEIGPDYYVQIYNGKRRGVGHNMNVGLAWIWQYSPLAFVLEDDWQLTRPLEIEPYVHLLINHAEIGMVRMGYLSAGLQGDIVSEEGKLWLKFRPNGYQYIYAGHASLRHKRLHDSVGMFSEGLAPGVNELDFCSKYNAQAHAPAIVWCMDYPHIGPFAHIGGQSLKDIQPEG